jgi:transposase-like protein
MPDKDEHYKYQKYIVKAIENALRAGATRSAAAQAVGINRVTLQRWIKNESLLIFPEKDKNDNERPVTTFGQMVEEAEAFSVVNSINNIQKAARGGGLAEKRTIVRRDGTEEVIEKYYAPQWTASAWLLERRHPDDWRARANVDMTKVSDEELLAKAAGLVDRFQAKEGDAPKELEQEPEPNQIEDIPLSGLLEAPLNIELPELDDRDLQHRGFGDNQENTEDFSMMPLEGSYNDGSS